MYMSAANNWEEHPGRHKDEIRVHQQYDFVGCGSELQTPSFVVPHPKSTPSLCGVGGRDSFPTWEENVNIKGNPNASRSCPGSVRNCCLYERPW